MNVLRRLWNDEAGFVISAELDARGDERSESSG